MTTANHEGQPLGKDRDGFAFVDRRYLLVTHIPFSVDEAGSVWLDRMWRHDLIQHLEYIREIRVCAPQVPVDSRANLVPPDAPPDACVSFTALPPDTSYLKALLHLPYTAGVLWRAIGQVDIVHSSVVGWPYPLGWIANPLAVLRGKRLVIVVESAWRAGGMGRRSWKDRLMDMDPVREWLARWSCSRADLALFTHSRYRDALCTSERGNAYVTPAVWVNEADILDEPAAEEAWATKGDQPVRMLFAGRLAAAKGIDVLLTALRSIDAHDVEMSVDIIGDGDLRDACVQAAADFRTVNVSVLAPVPYGPDFFALLRQYHALVIPSLSDEQPRIVFDANAQAVPVIASDTDGLRPYVVQGATGWLVRSGDHEALASALIRAGGAHSELRSMGLAALRATRALTHRAMHRSRSQALFLHCS